MASGLWRVTYGILLACVTISCAARDLDSAAEPPLLHADVRAVEVEDNEPLLYASLLDHPRRFAPGVIETFMSELYFSPRRLQFQDPKRPIFSTLTIREAGPLIREAFRTARPSQKISFRLQTGEGLTAGDSFILDGDLHWRFAMIKGVPQYENFYNIYEFGAETIIPRNWDLQLQEGQHYFAADVVLGVTKEKTDWVVMSLSPRAGGKSDVREEGDRASQPTKERRNLLDRLHVLQKLKEEGLISSDDFHRKVQALVEVKGPPLADPRERLRFLKELREADLISEKEYKERVREVLETL